MAKIKQWQGPGTIYWNGSRLWWKVKLPGETASKPRPLIPEGGTKATNNPDLACEIARAMYDNSVFNAEKSAGFDGSITNLIQKYMIYCREEYTTSNEAGNIKYGLNLLKEHYGNIPAEQFDSLMLLELQQYMIDKKLAQGTINRRISMIKKMFAWGVSRKLVPPIIHTSLSTVENIRKGRRGVKEPKKVKSVDKEHVLAILPYVTPVVADMIMVQYYTGMRSSELCDMIPEDIDQKTHKNVWIYEYKDKSYYRRGDGEKKKIVLGPKTQTILQKYMSRPADQYLFSPEESTQSMHLKRRENRTTKASYGNKPGSNTKEMPLSQPKDHYNKDGYRQAVQRGIARANAALRKELNLEETTPDPVPKWTPHQLRHSAGTNVRSDMGLDASSALLGHSDINTTKLYAELQLKKAIEAAEKHG